jgi:hypothetical protein
MDPLTCIRAETDRIHTACDETEIQLTHIEDADTWRAALGYIDEASRRVYQTRKVLLDEAIRRAQQLRESIDE